MKTPNPYKPTDYKGIRSNKKEDYVQTWLAQPGAKSSRLSSKTTHEQ
jgi:hypothetical protein